jgi:5-methylcytosine-specific restriction enzyme A
LRRDNYQCKECSRYGRTTQANTVHHIFPLETHPELRLTSDNLVSLCGKCHNEMHDRITNEITDKGVVWQDKVRMKLNL